MLTHSCKILRSRYDPVLQHIHIHTHTIAIDIFQMASKQFNEITPKLLESGAVRCERVVAKTATDHFPLGRRTECQKAHHHHHYCHCYHRRRRIQVRRQSAREKKTLRPPRPQIPAALCTPVQHTHPADRFVISFPINSIVSS